MVIDLDSFIGNLPDDATMEIRISDLCDEKRYQEILKFQRKIRAKNYETLHNQKKVIQDLTLQAQETAVRQALRDQIDPSGTHQAVHGAATGESRVHTPAQEGSIPSAASLPAVFTGGVLVDEGQHVLVTEAQGHRDGFYFKLSTYSESLQLFMTQDELEDLMILLNQARRTLRDRKIIRDRENAPSATKLGAAYGDYVRSGAGRTNQTST